MSNNLTNARTLLDTGSYTCVVCQGDSVYTATERGVKPLLDWLDSGLELTGFCENLPNGDVLLEVQGAKNRIAYLVFFLRSLTRIKVARVTATPLPIDPKETIFNRM